MNNIKPKFGEIYMASLEKNGHVLGGNRPVVIVQNNVGNEHAPTVEVIPMTSVDKAMHMPTHVMIKPDSVNNLLKESVVVAEQVTTINKDSLMFKIGDISKPDLKRIGCARNIQSPLNSL